MKLGVVVQRYGADISGGAELHARYIAERLAAHADVRVLTTCARDYVTWENEFPAGTDTVNGLPVERFPVRRPRDLFEFGRRSERVFNHTHSLLDELRWLDSQGPVSPALIERIERDRDLDFLLFFSARYYPAYYGARAVPDRAVLVPTAEREPGIGLRIFQAIFRGVRAIMYNTPEEQALINGLSGNEDVPGVVVGVGSNIPDTVDPARVRRKYGLDNPYLIYVGRIDANKGCAELFDFFLRHTQTDQRPLDLVLIGTPVLQVPDHPRIRHLGFLPDQDKFDAIAGAVALVMPSYYESLSMVALEAWALGRPVVANGRCDVLKGQCRRSNAGLYYEDAGEFSGALARLLADAPLSAALGRNGREFFARHYSWPVIERRYLDMFERLSSERVTRRMEPLPGWMARRARTCPPSARVIADLPAGAAAAGAGA